MDYIIKDYSTIYEQKLLDLANETLGVDYITKQVLDVFLTSKTEKCFVLIDTLNDNLVGFCMYDINTYEETQNITKNLLNPEFTGRMFGHVRTIAVNKDYQGQRLGNYILDKCIEKFNDLGITLLFTTIWDKPESRSNVRMVEHGGFTKAVTLKDYWLESSIKNGYDCPICGRPCHCSCIIMTNFL